MLTPEKCDQFLEFLKNNAHPGSGTPNTMNRYGLQLRDSPGWEVISRLLVEYFPSIVLSHISTSVNPHSFPSVLRDNFELTSHYSFLIEYYPKEGIVEKEENSHIMDEMEGDSEQSCPLSKKKDDESGKDRLAFHRDNSYVTFNLCLELPDDEIGSTLYFDYEGTHPSLDFKNTSKLLSVKQEKGFALVHEGCLRHGTSPILKEKRTNLIVWCR